MEVVMIIIYFARYEEYQEQFKKLHLHTWIWIYVCQEL